MKVHDATCPRCDIDTKVRHRPFSDQALSALLVWNEITERVVGQAICDSCYDELREILIDRNEEINNPKPDKSETRKVTPPAATKTAASAKAAPEKAAPAAATAKKAEKTKEKEKEKTAPAKGKKVRKVS